ncbi:MAG: hypothetical protein V1929_01885 [bacterium]
MDAFVQFAIYDHTGTSTPLADGSVIYIVGSLDGVNDGMDGYGDTNLVAGSFNNDDYLLATVRIGDGVLPDDDGMFFISIIYDSTITAYAYIRFFDTMGDPVTGLVYYGVSDMIEIPPGAMGPADVQFDPGGNLVTDLRTNFVVIPEPGTANLIMLVAGMACAMRASVKGRKITGNAAVHGGHG